MKHLHHTTPEEAGPTLAAIGRWLVSLNQLSQRLRPHFARPEPYQHVQLYLQAILSEIPRKNGWQIAEHARQPRPYGIQRLLSHATWDEAGVRDELRALVCHTLQPPAVLPAPADPAALFPVLVLDESGFPKRGRHSAGVGLQYCGTTGRVENCQVGVFLSTSPPWATPSSTASCICPKTGAPICRAGKPLTSPRRSPSRPNQNWPCG